MQTRLGHIIRLGFVLAFMACVAVVTSSMAVAAPYAAMVIDARTGKVLHSRNADTRLHPASLTKMMTLYIAFEAVQNGEIEQSGWTASSIWSNTTSGVKSFFRIVGLSFVDTDGDGRDNVTEYGEGTDPNVPDSPSVSLPLDNGDPRPVLGSVDSSPGDWNTPPATVYRNDGSATLGKVPTLRCIDVSAYQSSVLPRIV